MAKKILFSVILILSLLIIQNVLASHPAEDGAASYGLFQCTKKGSGDTCRTAWPNNDSNFYQAYKVEGKAIRFEGYGSLGKAGGRASVTACFTQYNIMFEEDGAICWYPLQEVKPGDTNNKVIVLVDSWEKDVDDNTVPYNYVSLSVFVDDASIFMEGGTVYGRRVAISKLTSDKTSVGINETFTVTWETKNAFLDRNLSWSGPIEKISPTPENIEAGSITFKTIGVGTATFNVFAAGPGIFQNTQIRTGEVNPADPDQPGTLSVNISSAPPPPPPPSVGAPGPFNLSGSCIGSTTANLGWTTSTNATSYRIERRIWTTGVWQAVGTTSATSFSESTSGVEDVYYRVYAVNSQGQTLSTPSEVFTCGAGGAAPPPPPPGPPPPPPGDVTLTVTTAGNGSVVSQNPVGINCGPNSTCSAQFPLNSTPELVATPASGLRVTWSGDCGTIIGNTCHTSMTAPKSVTATFSSGPVPPPTGTITISSKEINTGSPVPVNTNWTLFYGGSIVNQETGISFKTYSGKPAGQYDLQVLIEGTTHIFDHFDITPANQFLASGGTLDYVIWYRPKSSAPPSPGPGEVQAFCTVTVSSPPAPTLSFSANPTTVAYGGSTNLSWSSANTNSCTASGGWSGSKSTNSSQTISGITSGTTFTLTCFGPGGSISRDASVNVSTPVPSVSNVTVTQPNYCLSGPAATIGWTYSDATGSPQLAYQVQIDDRGSFQNPEWDSAKVSCSGCRSNSTPQGILQFNTTYKARVRAWNQFDAASSWAESGSWKTPPHAYPQVDFFFAAAAPGQQTFIPEDPIQFTDQTVFFDSNPRGRRWNWNFGDGTSSTKQNPIKSYPSEGNFNVTLTSTDNANQSCSISKPINIKKSNPIWKEVNPGG